MEDNNKTIYDLIIIGGSIAAATAGIYAARRNLNFKIISKDFGGEVATSGEIGNWPGVIHTDGITLSSQFRAHLEHYKVDMEEGIWVQNIAKQPDGLFCISAKRDVVTIDAADKLNIPLGHGFTCDYLAKTVIVATGAHPRQLGIPGEKEFQGKGVTYCTVCDGPLFGGKVTAVVGGGNSALEAALMLADIATKVYVINKNSEFNGEQVLVDTIKAKSNIELIFNADTKAIKGEKFVNSIEYADAGGIINAINVEGVFVHIGVVPNSELLGDAVVKDEFKQIIVNANCATNIPGLFAAGDVTNVPFRQIIIAGGQGCIALLSAVSYLNKLN